MLQLASANSLPGPSGSCWPIAGSPEQSSAAVKTAHDFLDMIPPWIFALYGVRGAIILDGSTSSALGWTAERLDLLAPHVSLFHFPDARSCLRLAAHMNYRTMMRSVRIRHRSKTASSWETGSSWETATSWENAMIEFENPLARRA